MAYNPNYFGATASAAEKTTSGYQNGTLSTITKATPVATNGSGQAILLDVTDETNVFRWIGLYAQDTVSGATGQVIDNGRLENITTGFSVGDFIYAGSTPGTLINVKPDIGVSGFASGDFVIFIGVLVKNQFNPSQIDLKLVMLNIGQL